MCSHEGCELPTAKAGYCNAHYIRKRRGRDMSAPVRRHGADPERFWEKVLKSETCWEWQAFRGVDGYGRVMINGVPHLAHRVSFERTVEPIPDGVEIDHMCHNRACVNPGHLRLSTRELNGQNLSGARRDSASGVRGVRRRDGKWSAEAKANGQRVRLGRFALIEDAEAAVVAWRRENMPFSLMDRAV